MYWKTAEAQQKQSQHQIILPDVAGSRFAFRLHGKKRKHHRFCCQG